MARLHTGGTAGKWNDKQSSPGTEDGLKNLKGQKIPHGGLCRWLQGTLSLFSTLGF